MAKTHALGLLFLAAVPLAVINAACFFFTTPMMLRGQADFRHLYTAGYMVRSGHGGQLYDYETARAFQNHLVSDAGSLALPFNHLAYEALFYAPLSLLRYRPAYWLLAGINLGLLMVSFGWLTPHFRNLSRVPQWLPFALPLGFFPSIFAISEGQDSIVIFALAVFAFALVESGFEPQGGAILGLTLFKFQFAVPIAILYLCWRRWSFVKGFVICGTAIVVLSAGIVGPAGLLLYAHELISMSTHMSADSQLRYGIHPDLMMNLRGFLYGILHDKISQASLQFITSFLSIAALAWAARKRPSFPLAVAVAVLVSYHCLPDDAVLLLIPLATLVSQGSAGTTAAACLIFVLPTVLFYGGHRFYLMALPLTALIALLGRPRVTADYCAATAVPILIPITELFHPKSRHSKLASEPEGHG